MNKGNFLKHFENIYNVPVCNLCPIIFGPALLRQGYVIGASFDLQLKLGFPPEILSLAQL